IVAASSSIVLLNGLGSVAGPVVVSTMMRQHGPPAYFFSLAGMLASLVLYAAWRKWRRSAVPAALKVPFVSAQPEVTSGEMMAQVAHDAALAHAHTEREHAEQAVNDERSRDEGTCHSVGSSAARSMRPMSSTG